MLKIIKKHSKLVLLLLFVLLVGLGLTGCGNDNGLPETDFPDIDSITTEQDGVNAFANYNQGGEDTLLYFQAREIGKEVNESIELHFNADEENQEFELQIEKENEVLKIQVYLETDEEGNSESTAKEVANEIASDENLMVLLIDEDKSDVIIEGGNQAILDGGSNPILKVEWAENIEENNFNFIYVQYAHGYVDEDYIKYAEVSPEVDNENSISYLNFGGLRMYELHDAIGELRLIVDGEQRDRWHYQDEEEPTWKPGAHSEIE